MKYLGNYLNRLKYSEYFLETIFRFKNFCKPIAISSTG